MRPISESASFDLRVAVLEARNEATPDGVLVLDEHGAILLKNRNFGKIWKMPEEVLRTGEDAALLQHAITMVEDGEGFRKRIEAIYNSQEETSYDELRFRDGRIIERYGRAVRNEQGEKLGWAWFFRDITSRKEQEIRHKKILESLPLMAWTAAPDGTVDYLNSRWYQYTGQTEQEAHGNGWAAAIAPGTEASVFEKWKYSLQHNIPFEGEVQYRRIDGTYRWHLTRAVPIIEGNQTVMWVGTCTDIHDQKLQEQELEKRVQKRTADLAQEKAFVDSMLEASITGIMALDAVRNKEGQLVDFTLVKINSQLTRIVKIDQSAIGKSYLSLFTNSLENGVFDLYKSVYESGEPQRMEVYSTNLDLNSWFEISAAKRSDNGIVASVVNISQQREAAKHIEEQKNLLDSILRHSPSGLTVYKALRDGENKIADFQCVLANEAAELFTGVSNEQRYTKTVLETTPSLKQTPLFTMAVAAVEEGTPFRTEYHNQEINRWLELSVVKVFEDHLINVFRDITPIKEAQLELERSANRLQAVFNASQSGMFTFSPVRDASGEIVDFRFVITNPTFASYVSQSPEVLNGQLGSTWFPGYLTNGVFDMYKKTYLTGEAQRMDIHYNVDQHDIYLDLQSSKVGDEVLVTFNDYTALKKAQLELERYVDELRKTNANLEEFAYAASHDLKEPVRKINVFTDRLRASLEKKLNEEQERFFDRVQFSAKRMASLIDDLLMYSYVTRGATLETEVNLNEKIALVLQDLDLEIEEKKAVITVEQLPTIKGHRRQLQQLFQNLVTNALKYHKDGEPPEITIGARKIKGSETLLALSDAAAAMEYHCISVQDKGIGFDPADADRIFKVFTRLDNPSGYKGTGVGLSIVEKIVQNHGGYVWAEGRPGEGARFHVLLPVEQE